MPQARRQTIMSTHAATSPPGRACSRSSATPTAGPSRATSFLGDNVTLTAHDRRDGSLYAALNHGHFGVKLHRSRDGGATWQQIATPVYPPSRRDTSPKTPVEGTPADWSLKLVWALAAGGADEPGVLWCGTLPGGLFRSDDHGESWVLNRPLWDDPAARGVVRRRRRPPGHPLDPASTRATPRTSRSASPAAASGRRAIAARRGR